MPPPGQLTPHQIIVARNLKDGITPPQKQPVKNNPIASNPINPPAIEILKTPSISPSNSNTSNNTSNNLPGIFQILKTSSIVNLEPSTNLINQPKGLFDDLIRTSSTSNNNIQPNNMYLPNISNNSNNSSSDKQTNNVVTTPETGKGSYIPYIIGFVIIYVVLIKKK